jgi:oligopeptide transport system permease protein
MIRYVGLRVIQGAAILLAVATITFVLLRFLPGGPFDRDKALPPEIRRNVEARYALDRPLAEQYARYLAGLVRGDLGPSYKYVGRDVREIIAEGLPVSAGLGALALGLALVGGIGMGLVAGSRPGSALDRAVMLISVLGISVPSFVLAAALVYGLALRLGAFPAGLWEGPEHAVLPTLALAALPLATIAQLARVSVIEVARLDFVRTARAKGVREARVFLHHVLRNAWLAVVTYFGPLLATLLTGSFVVEKIFAVPGIGRFFVTAVTDRDHPLVLGVTLVYCALVVAANLVVDLLYAWIDPRIRMGRPRG